MEQIFSLCLNIEIVENYFVFAGALEIGVTTFDPNDQTNQLPSTMSLMEDGTWMLVGESVMHKLQAVKENYHRGTGALQVSILTSIAYIISCIKR